MADDLIDLAQQVLHQAYAPYSGFHVGAALRAASGRVYIGCNVENASYGLAICAERSALAAAVSAEGRQLQIVEVAVRANKVGHGPCGASPCGACRQALIELGPDAVVHYLNPELKPVARSLSELLVDSFRL
ncbi:cytidine deaminase [Ahniella affigens]|nr:cytidine deaminase [Ahniella affigens]